MVSVPIHSFDGSDLSLELNADKTEAVVTIPQDGLPPMTVSAEVENNALNLLTDRSFMHRTIAIRLGIPL